MEFAAVNLRVRVTAMRMDANRNAKEIVLERSDAKPGLGEGEGYEVQDKMKGGGAVVVVVTRMWTGEGRRGRRRVRLSKNQIDASGQPCEIDAALWYGWSRVV